MNYVEYFAEGFRAPFTHICARVPRIIVNPILSELKDAGLKASTRFPILEVDANGLTRQEFMEKFASVSKPVLVRGCAKDWKATK